MPLRYPLSSYDKNFCLRPTAVMWAALFYLSRAIVLPWLLGVGAMAGLNSDSRAFFSGLFDLPTLLPSALALIVLLAQLRRAPEASRAVRWIWAQGRWFLALAAVLDGALTLFRSPIWHADYSQEAGLSLIGAGVDLYLLGYLLIARRVRDTFADFPEPAEPQASPR